MKVYITYRFTYSSPGKGKQLDGDICPGIATGTRKTVGAMRELGINPLEDNHDLIVNVEIDGV
ncbi:MAG: hypothetical protein GXY48_13725 [Methanomicrobiales archaeon]|nr:hypothetical protein [Methanomicrobiales archaeon]